jgi:hypothetical protein
MSPITGRPIRPHLLKFPPFSIPYGPSGNVQDGNYSTAYFCKEISKSWEEPSLNLCVFLLVINFTSHDSFHFFFSPFCFLSLSLAV